MIHEKMMVLLAVVLVFGTATYSRKKRPGINHQATNKHKAFSSAKEEKGFEICNRAEVLKERHQG